MSTEQEDAALLFELQEKITTRIREQIFLAFNGYENTPGSIPTDALSAPSLRGKMMSLLINDPYFISEITRKIGAKMANVNY